MRATLGNQAIFKYDDFVCTDYRGKAVSDDKRCAATADDIERRLDFLFCRSIECRRGFIENEDRRSFKDCAGNRHALLFAA